MKSKVVNHIEITLTLDELEAAWLKAVMQNPFHEDESETDKTMRGIFWKALTTHGIITDGQPFGEIA